MGVLTNIRINLRRGQQYIGIVYGPWGHESYGPCHDHHMFTGYYDSQKPALSIGTFASGHAATQPHKLYLRTSEAAVA